jgi:hypothetical protein
MPESAADALDTYFAKHPATRRAVVVNDATPADADAELRELISRRIELRLMGYDVGSKQLDGSAARAMSPHRQRVGMSSPVRPLASFEPDEGAHASKEEADADDEYAETTSSSSKEKKKKKKNALASNGEAAESGTEAYTVTSSHRARAADAILKRLVAELRQSDEEGETGEAGAWAPSGTDWSETPEFLNGANAGGGVAMLREKYPDMFAQVG